MNQAVADLPSQLPEPPPVTAADLRRACGLFATGVTVVTVRDGDRFRGMTANSFTSVSLDPPLVLVSIDRRNRTHYLLSEGNPFVVNVLSRAQQCWSDRFAGRHGDVQHQFEDVPHTLSPDGVPIIAGAAATFSCRVEAIHPAGDHSLFVGRVERIDSTPGAAPLLFFAGKYRAMQVDEGVADPVRS